MNCDYCDYELETHENVLRGSGYRYCDVCVARLGANLDPVLDSMSDLLVEG